ncbi:MAG TPA: SDR family oxidoreductase [Thermoanaerobaculia bacterium]|nr:SDR family oxidoreductase [Thermoanaerobaculia bacterium]
MASRKVRKPASERSSGGTILFTGFPGFIGARLIPRLLELRPEATLECLVQEKFLAAADASVAALATSHPHTEGRVRLVTGDITAPGLGLGASPARSLARRVTGCCHLAAVYDLAVSKDVGMRINVEGTRNVLEFLGGAPRLRRLDYVSTAYVSGTAVGTFREKDLDVGQSFKNHYEETKFLAEVAVRESGIPATVYRPGIVVGDSRTGETAKFDGPYFALNAMSLLPSPGAFLRIGDGSAEVNLVPVDYVLEAIARLGAWDGAVGKTYHLTDPKPETALGVAELLAKSIGKSFVFVPVPLPLARIAFVAPQVSRWLGMPGETLDYFDHPVHYDSAAATRDLKRFGVACPPFVSYVQRLVAFWKKKRAEITRGAMI